MYMWNVMKKLNKQNRDRPIGGEQADSSDVELGGGGIKQKRKRTHGHGHQCSDCRGEGGISVLNGNGKIQYFLNIKKTYHPGNQSSKPFIMKQSHPMQWIIRASLFL